MKLLTFNIRTSAAIFDLNHHWAFRKDAALAAIKLANADIVGLQEVRAKPLAFLAEGLAPAVPVAAGRNDGQTKGEALPIFVGSTFSLDSFEFRWFSETPDAPGSKFENTSQPRIATIARVTEIATNKKAAFVNVHLDTNFVSVRTISLALLHEWAKADEIPWVVFGDFNCAIDSAEMRPLLDSGWSDALASMPPAGPDVATFSSFKKHTEGMRIDHVLIPPAVTVSSAQILNDTTGKAASDHWPVLVELDL